MPLAYRFFVYQTYFASIYYMNKHPKNMINNIALGTASYGTGTHEDDAFRYLDYFYEHGGRQLDTAHIYGIWAENGEGASEKCIGTWIQARNNPDNLYIITKGAHPDFKTNEKRVSKSCINNDIQDSLTRLQREYIDLYFLHRDDEGVPVSEIAHCLHEAYEQGYIKAFGLSNWHTQRIDELSNYCKTNKLITPSANQLGYSIARATESAGSHNDTHYLHSDSFNWHRDSQLPVYAFSSQAQGLFSKCGNYQELCDHNRLNTYKTDKNSEIFKHIHYIAKELDATPVQVALAGLLHSPFPCHAIIGNSNMQQLEESLAAKDLTLNETQINKLFAHWH